jgi:hypothetical protein
MIYNVFRIYENPAAAYLKFGPSVGWTASRDPEIMELLIEK